MSIQKNIIALILLACSASALAYRPGVQIGSIRCDGQVVRVGDAAWELLEACGRPQYRDVVAVEYHRASWGHGARWHHPSYGLVVEQPIEEWVYTGQRGRLTRVITVIAGRLVQIELH